MKKNYKNMKLVLTNEASEEITLEYEIQKRLRPYSRVKSLKVDSTFESTQP